MLLRFLDLLGWPATNRFGVIVDGGGCAVRTRRNTRTLGGCHSNEGPSTSFANADCSHLPLDGPVVYRDLDRRALSGKSWNRSTSIVSMSIP